MSMIPPPGFVILEGRYFRLEHISVVRIDGRGLTCIVLTNGLEYDMRRLSLEQVLDRIHQVER